MKIDFNSKELTVLKRILYAENKKFFDLADHAAAHGQEFTADHQIVICQILAQIDPE